MKVNYKDIVFDDIKLNEHTYMLLKEFGFEGQDTLAEAVKFICGYGRGGELITSSECDADDYSTQLDVEDSGDCETFIDDYDSQAEFWSAFIDKACDWIADRCTDQWDCDHTEVVYEPNGEPIPVTIEPKSERQMYMEYYGRL